jgi:hypothetical protein
MSAEATDSRTAAPGKGSGATVKAPSVEVGGGITGFGFSQVVAGLLRQAAAKQPETAARLRGKLGLQSSDHESGVTVHFEGERIRVLGDVDPDVQLCIEAPVMSFGKLGSQSYATRAYLSREIRVKGMFRHPLQLRSFRRFLGGLDFS